MSWSLLETKRLLMARHARANEIVPANVLLLTKDVAWTKLKQKLK